MNEKEEKRPLPHSRLVAPQNKKKGNECAIHIIMRPLGRA